MLRHEGTCSEWDDSRFERLVSDLDLLCVTMDLKSPKGARHWHLRRPKTTGTLEVTWLPAGRVIVEARANRSAPWQSEVADRLFAELSHGL